MIKHELFWSTPLKERGCYFGAGKWSAGTSMLEGERQLKNVDFLLSTNSATQSQLLGAVKEA